jgi:hypothetical protein
MGGNMKTTIDIADGLLEEARTHAEAEGTTVRALVERGLRSVLAERPPPTPWRWEPVTFELHPEVDLRDWSEVREMIYEEDRE